jgi:chemotaxis signal transduction protein
MIATAATRPAFTPPPARPDTADIVRIEIAGLGFALPLAAIATILSPSAMIARDDDAGWAGFVPSRGGEIPIADGRSVFDLAGPPPSERRLLILRGSPATGLLVDAIHGTTAIPSGDISWLSPLFGPVERLLTQSVAWGSGGTLDLVIDVPALRRHLHLGTDHMTSSATAQIAAIFATTPPGDRLEVRLDDSDRRWMLPIAWVRHISDPRPPARLPHADPSILGLLAWRRDPIPLIDTARALDLTPTTPTTLIVLGPESQPDDALLALTVRGIAGVSSPDTDAESLDLQRLVDRLGRG